MKTLKLTDEMVERLQHFYNLPEFSDDEDYEDAVDIVRELAEQINK